MQVLNLVVILAIVGVHEQRLEAVLALHAEAHLFGANWTIIRIGHLRSINQFIYLFTYF